MRTGRPPAARPAAPSPPPPFARRPAFEEETLQTARARSRRVRRRLRAISRLARRSRGFVFTNLTDDIDEDLVRYAWDGLRKSAAPGIDGVTARRYRRRLERRLRRLLRTLRGGTWRPHPARLVLVRKAQSDEFRRLCIPVLEDRLVQRVLHLLLQAVFEPDFLDCSWAYRPRRGTRPALRDVWTHLRVRGGFVLEADIEDCFDRIDRDLLRGLLDERVRDPHLRLLVDRFLEAGVLEEGRFVRPELGTPQGGALSPLLCNIYLHGALDRWLVREYRREVKGFCWLVRYADDFVVLFSRREEAERARRAIERRLRAFGLSLHPDKTRIVPILRPGDPRRREGAAPDAPSGHFEFLGFTHRFARGRSGAWVLKQTTSKASRRRTLERWRAPIRRDRRLPLAEQHRRIVQRLRGWYRHHDIPGNGAALVSMRADLALLWKRALHAPGGPGRRTPRLSDLRRSLPLPDRFTGGRRTPPPPVLRPPRKRAAVPAPTSPRPEEARRSGWRRAWDALRRLLRLGRGAEGRRPHEDQS